MLDGRKERHHGSVAPEEGSSGELVRGMTSDRKTPPRAARSRRRRAADPIEDPIQQAIGDKLKEVFVEVVEQPVPERFTLLLEQLEAQERQKK